MKKDEYLEKAISLISNKKAKDEVKAELSSHLDDLIDFYLDRGCTEAEAEEKAVADMGEAEIVAVDLAKLHKGLPGVLSVFLTFLTLFSVGFFGIACPLNIGFSGYVYHYNFNAEFAFLGLVLLMSVLWRKKLHIVKLFILPFVYLAAILGYAFCFDTTPLDGFCSPTVFYAAYLAMGRFESIKAIMNLCVSKIPFAFSVISVAFYALILILLFANAVSALRITRKKYKPKDKKISVCISRTLTVLLVAVSLVFTLTYPLSFYYRNHNVDTYHIVDGEDVITVLIAQSDTPKPLAELTYNDMYMFSCDNYFGLGIGSEEYFSSSPLQEQLSINSYEREKYSYDEFVSYYIDRVCFEFTPQKEYVYVVFVEGDPFYQELKNNYDESLWKKADKEYNFHSNDKEIYPNSYYSLTVHDKQE